MILAELFHSDSPMKVKWTMPYRYYSEYDSFHGEFETPSGATFKIEITHSKRLLYPHNNNPDEHIPEWTFKFDQENRKERAHSQLTNRNKEQFLIYGTMVAVIREFLESEQPAELSFYAWTHRQDLVYKAMIKYFRTQIEAAGYHILIEPYLGTSRFYLVKNDVVGHRVEVQTSTNT